jgi:hypothetical protein
MAMDSIACSPGKRLTTRFSAEKVDQSVSALYLEVSPTLCTALLSVEAAFTIVSLY